MDYDYGGGGGMTTGIFGVSNIVDVVETVGTTDIEGNVLVQGGPEGNQFSIEPGTPPQVTRVAPPPPPAQVPVLPPPPPVEEPPPPPSYGAPRKPTRPTGGYGGGPETFDADETEAFDADDGGDVPVDIYGRSPALQADDGEFEDDLPSPRAAGFARLVSAGGKTGGNYRKQPKGRPNIGVARITSARGSKSPRLTIKRFPIEKLSAALAGQDPLDFISRLEAAAPPPVAQQQARQHSPQMRSQRITSSAAYGNRALSKKSKWKTVGAFPSSAPLQAGRGITTSSGKWPANVEHRGRTYRGMQPVVLHLSMKGTPQGGTTKRPKWVRSIMLIPSSVDMKANAGGTTRRRHKLYVEE